VKQTTKTNNPDLRGTVLLSADNISKFYGEGRRRIQVLRDICLDIREGEIVVVLGPSGAGKSTLLRILSGLSKPSGGRVLFRGEPHEGPNASIAIVFQTFALFPWLTVYENVEVGVLNSDLSETQRRRSILKAIDTIGLDGFEDAYPKELSGGMRQRVGFARALVVEPEILFMDEPFSTLDVLTAENLKKELLSLWAERKIPTKAVVLVTHNIDEAVTMGDRLVVMGTDPGNIRVDMPGLPLEERAKDHPEHIRMVDYLYGVMTNPSEVVAPFGPETPVAMPEAPALRPFQVLPHVEVGQITGLVERLHSANDREDIYVVGRDLNMEVDDLLPLVQALDLLGLGDVEEGDVFLTPVGVRFADAGLQERKEIFRDQARENVQLIRAILHGIESDIANRIRWDDVLEDMERQFTTEEAERQLDTAIDWGRYAELFAYDDSDGVFSRESEEYSAPPEGEEGESEAEE
jgi:NitT/TauT family transport system ATP-binding protein